MPIEIVSVYESPVQKVGFKHALVQGYVSSHMRPPSLGLRGLYILAESVDYLLNDKSLMEYVFYFNNYLAKQIWLIPLLVIA